MASRYADCRDYSRPAEEDLDHNSKRNFILQQGIEDPVSATCPGRYDALVFQPRIVAAVLLVGILLQSPAVFLVLGAFLWWSALMPKRNPLDAVYNATIGSRPGNVRLDPAPRPRRFAQAIAGGFSMAVAIALFTGNDAAAYLIEILFAAAVAALSFGRFCLGSFLYHILHGRIRFAMQTLPWRRDRE